MFKIARWTKNIVNIIFRRHPRTLEEALGSNKLPIKKVGLFELGNKRGLPKDAGKVLDNIG